jgi:hypothetical protein
MTRLLLVCLAALAGAAHASAATTITRDAQRPALRVDAQGNAEVSWTAGGVRRTVFVPPTGKVYPGRKLTAPDVSRADSSVALPYKRVLRRTPDGRLWALQAWRPAAGAPVELRFSRWKGAPPAVTLATEQRFDGERLTGHATFGGRPVPLFSPTPEGKRIRSYAYVERRTGAGWGPVAGVATKANGSFQLFVPKGKLGTAYRALVLGPNVGTTLAPDGVSAVVPTAR